MAWCCSAAREIPECDMAPQGPEAYRPMVPGPMSTDNLRERLLDGVHQVHANPTVSKSKRVAISITKTLICWGCLAAGAIGTWKLKSAEFVEDLDRSPLELELKFCGPNAPALVANDTGLSNGLDELLSIESHKIFRFVPTGRIAMSSIWYYESEELRAEPLQTSYAFSFGMFGHKGLQLHVKVDDGTPEEVACLPAPGRARDDRAEDLFGLAVVQHLKKAGRRTPRASIPTVPGVHGALLIRNDDTRVWSSSLDKFNGEYHVSLAMKIYSYIVIALRICATIGIILGAGRAGLQSWWQATEVWVPQYDYLWERMQYDIRGFQQNAHFHHISDAEVKSLMGSRSAWKLANACGVFWVLDHVVGNPELNQESCRTAIVSAFVQGVSLVSLIGLPLLHTFFFPEWNVFCYSIVAFHLLQSAGFSMAYYWGMPLQKREGFYYGFLASATALVVYNIAYAASITLFMATRLVVMPGESICIIGSLGSVLLYSVMMTTGLRRMRIDVISKMTRSRATHGEILEALEETGLDDTRICTTIAVGTCSIFLLSVIIVLASQMYFDVSSNSQFVGSGLALLTVGLVAYRKLEGTQAAVKDRDFASVEPKA